MTLDSLSRGLALLTVNALRIGAFLLAVRYGVADCPTMESLQSKRYEIERNRVLGSCIRDLSVFVGV